MVDFKAPREELASYVETNTPWSVVAKQYGYSDGREARIAAFRAYKQLEDESAAAAPTPA